MVASSVKMPCRFAGAVASVLGLVGLLAAYVSARCAGRVDPLKVLREN